MNTKGQSLLELVMGIGLITVIMGAMSVVAINTLRNTQFSKNQTQATKFAQDNLEKVRTIKDSNFPVCLINETSSTCSTWENIWAVSFGTVAGGTCTSSSGCTFVVDNNSANCPPQASGGATPFCLKYSGTKGVSGRFTFQIIIEDEGVLQNLQKRVTSRVFWTDTASAGSTSPEHSSDLVTILTRH